MTTNVAKPATYVRTRVLLCGIMVAVVALVVTACSGGDFIGQALPIMERFDARQAVAANTARIGLAPVIMEMQDLVAEVDAIPTGDTEMKNLVLRAMNLTIDYYMAFQSQATDARMASLKEEAESAWTAIADLQEIRNRDGR